MSNPPLRRFDPTTGELREATQAESDARDAGILRQLPEVLQTITGTRNGSDLIKRIEDIYDIVKAGDWTVGDARQALGLEREPPVDQLA
jgi:hypothetical protein